MKDNSNYIQPNIVKYASLRDLLNDKDSYDYLGYRKSTRLTFDDILSIERTFIIAEPGYGKTRLLKEVVIEAGRRGKQAIFLDLKKSEGDLSDLILKKTEMADSYCAGLDVQRSSLFKTGKFALNNNEKVIVCLDALDEVKHEDFSNIVDSIKGFSKRYKSILLFVSCRWHHFQKYHELFSDIDFGYVRINPFTREQVCTYFERQGVSRRDMERIIQILEFRNRDLIIQNPRYLEMMAVCIKDKDVENLKKLTKTGILEWFIYRKLDIEGKKLGFQNKEIVKRVLEKIALLMEMYQTNILSKEELITIFDDVKSNLNLNFLQQDQLDFLFERTILKDNIDTIEFENTEFQEYLAAKEILRLGRADQTVFDLAVDQELQEIFLSWFNTLNFLVDLDISLLKLLLDFGASKSKFVQNEEYHRFLTKVDVERLTIDERNEIFSNVFTYYQEVLHWIPFDVARNLSYYFHTSQDKLLRRSIETVKETSTANFVRRSNVAYVVGFFLERDVFNESQKGYWRDKLIEFVKDKNKNGVLQRHALFALGKFKDIDLLKGISQLRNSDDELIIENFIEACIDVNPNDPFSVDTFVEGTKKKNIHAHNGLYQIKEKSSIKELLNYFSKDENFLFQFIDEESIFRDKVGELVQNIRNVWDCEIEKKLKQIIINAFSSQQWYQSEKSKLIESIVLLLEEKEKNYIFSLLKSIKNNTNLQRNLFSFGHIFAILLKKHQVGEFIKELRKLEHGENIALNILQEINISSRKDAKKVYEEGRRHCKKEYKQLEKVFAERLKQTNREDCIYKEFRLKLEPEKGKYVPNVFQFYLSNKEIIDNRMKSVDKKRLEDLIKKSIFEKLDPGRQKLTITRRDPGGSRSYTTHSYISIFGTCLIVAKKLGIDISKYRKNIINYIPFAYSEHLEAIFSLIPSPNLEEINSLLKIYSGKRKDDLPCFMPSSFIGACKKYKISNAIPILKKFTEQTEISIYERQSALESMVDINPEEKYLIKTFKKYMRQNDDTFQLAEEANKHLIEKFSNEAAIKWRFKQLIRRAKPFTKPKGVEWVSDFEDELFEKKFARPLISLKDPKYKTDFLNLLDTSFKIVKKGDNYSSYTNYLWDIVTVYFDNLKETKSYNYLRDLEKHITQHSSSEGINWFKYKLIELRRKYMDYIGKPNSIAECIKRYNKLKEIQYLDISTPRDLIEIVKDIVNKDIKRFVEEEGFYKSIQDMKGSQEDLIQKTLTTQLENSFLKKGFRKNEINIRREEQLLDNKRTDFLISYGFIGPVLIEVKRTDNKEVSNFRERIMYKDKFLQYIKGSKAHFGLFILFQIKKKYPLENCLTKLRKVYKDCELVEVIGLNCLKT